MPAKIACLVFGAIVAFWFIRRELNRKYWLLTETELICGRWNAKTLPLSSIKKIPPLLIFKFITEIGLSSKVEITKVEVLLRGL